MSSSRDLLLTLFGEHLSHRSDPVWVGSLVRLLAPLGVSDGAVRTALSRMTSEGWMVSSREGRHAFYRLTPSGREEVASRDRRRTYRGSWKEPWDGRWTLVHYSIGGERPGLRERLRRRLRRLGFGSAGGGVWLSPHPMVELVRELASGHEVEDQLQVFRAEYRGPDGADGLLDRCWELPELNEAYEEFIDRRLEQYHRCRRDLAEGALPGESAYVLHLELMLEFADFPLADPVLPPALQPETWGGECAEVLFDTMREMLVTPASDYVDGILAEARREISPPASRHLEPEERTGRGSE